MVRTSGDSTLSEPAPHDREAPAGALAGVHAERVLGAPIAALWPLWATKEGLESWWAPAGFVLAVKNLDVRVGGRIDFVYAEASTVGDPEWRKEFERHGIPPTFTAQGTFLDVARPTRLAFRQFVDYGPKSHPQEFRMRAAFRGEGSITHVALSAEAPPTRHWTLLGKQNLVGQLNRLEKALTNERLPG